MSTCKKPLETLVVRVLGVDRKLVDTASMFPETAWKTLESCHVSVYLYQETLSGSLILYIIPSVCLDVHTVLQQYVILQVIQLLLYTVLDKTGATTLSLIIMSLLSLSPSYKSNYMVNVATSKPLN